MQKLTPHEVAEVTFIFSEKKKYIRTNAMGMNISIPIDEAIYVNFQNQFPRRTEAQINRYKTLMNITRAAYLKGLADGKGNLLMQKLTLHEVAGVTFIFSEKKKYIRVNAMGMNISILIDEAIYVNFQNQFPRRTVDQINRYKTLMNITKAVYLKGFVDGKRSKVM